MPRDEVIIIISWSGSLPRPRPTTAPPAPPFWSVVAESWMPSLKCTLFLWWSGVSFSGLTTQTRWRAAVEQQEEGPSLVVIIIDGGAAHEEQQQQQQLKNDWI